MNETTTTTTIETLLEEAGFSFEVVERCPHRDCPVCMRDAQPKAA